MQRDAPSLLMKMRHLAFQQLLRRRDSCLGDPYSPPPFDPDCLEAGLTARRGDNYLISWPKVCRRITRQWQEHPHVPQLCCSHTALQWDQPRLPGCCCWQRRRRSRRVPRLLGGCCGRRRRRLARLAPQWASAPQPKRCWWRGRGGASALDMGLAAAALATADAELVVKVV